MALNHKSASSFGNFHRFHLEDWFSSIGNIISLVARAMFAGVVGLVFAQLFWRRNQQEKLTAKQIDAIMALKDRPFGPTALRSWRSSWLLSATTSLVAVLVVVTIVAPGSLEVEMVKTDQDCEKLSVDLSNATIATFQDAADGKSFIYANPTAQTNSFVAKVVLGGEYLPPVEANLTADDDTSLIYSLTFDAPSFSCQDVTNSVNLTSLLPLPASPTGPVVVWNSTFTFDDEALIVNVASRQLLPDPQKIGLEAPGLSEAMTCAANVSSYVVKVTEGLGNGTVTVLNLTPKSPITRSSPDMLGLQYAALADGLARLLNGTATYNRSTFNFTQDSSFIAFTPLGTADSNSPWSWPSTTSMRARLQELMAEVSVSLLSGVLSDASSPTLTPQDSQCLLHEPLYSYDRMRLFLTYGIAILVTAVCMLIGFIVIHMNGREETVDFSRIMSSFVGEEEFEEARAVLEDIVFG